MRLCASCFPPSLKALPSRPSPRLWMRTLPALPQLLASSFMVSTMADAALLVQHRHRLKGLMDAGRVVVLADVLSPEEVEVWNTVALCPPSAKHGQMASQLSSIVLASWWLAGVCYSGPWAVLLTFLLGFDLASELCSMFCFPLCAVVAWAVSSRVLLCPAVVTPPHHTHTIKV